MGRARAARRAARAPVASRRVPATCRASALTVSRVARYPRRRGASPTSRGARARLGRRGGGSHRHRLRSHSRVRQPLGLRARRAAARRSRRRAIAALTFGLTLIWLSRSLARRRRRAWQLAVVLVVGLSVAHLVKGLDFEEATLTLLVLAALFGSASGSTCPAIRSSCARLSSRRSRSRRLPRSSSCSTCAGSAAIGSKTSRRGRASCSASGAAPLAAAALAACPCSQPKSAGSSASSSARTATTASRSSACAATRATSSRRRRRSFLAYKVVGGCALVSGDPVGDGRSSRSCSRSSGASCHTRGWRLALLSVRSELATGRARARAARDQDRRRGGRSTRRVLPRRPADSQGPPVGDSRWNVRATASASSRQARSTRRCARSSSESPRSGAARTSSAASRWRWTTTSASRRRSSRSPSETGRSAAFSISSPAGRASRSGRCAATPARRTA